MGCKHQLLLCGALAGMPHDTLFMCRLTPESFVHTTAFGQKGSWDKSRVLNYFITSIKTVFVNDLEVVNTDL